MKRHRGTFIVLDGLDGSGKGTQIALLAERLFQRDKANHFFLTREPYHSSYGVEIRRILLRTKNPLQHAERLTALFVNDRIVHAHLIEQLLQEGNHVICDRYKYSTLAYQQTQGIPIKRLIEMHRGVLVPDLAIILDVSAEVAMQRMKNDIGVRKKEMFDQLAFLRILQGNYLRLPRQLPTERIKVINGNATVEKVFRDVKKEVEEVW